MDSLLNPEIWIALATLTALELVLGIDNIIFISILAAKVPPAQRDMARKVGIALAAVTRLGLLLAIAWIVGLTAPLFSVFGHAFSWRDLILIGLVLIADGFGQHIPKGYIYAAMAFSVFVELINLWIRKRSGQQTRPVDLHERFED